jgi:hypothetical protein
MAVTTTGSDLGIDRVSFIGRERVARRRLTLSGTYATGGFDFTSNDCRMKKIKWVQFMAPASTGSAVAFPYYDAANNKIKLFTATGTEFTNAGSVTGYILDLEAGGY